MLHGIFKISSSPLLILSTHRFLSVEGKKTVKVEDYELTRGDVCGMLEEQVKICGNLIIFLHFLLERHYFVLNPERDPENLLHVCKRIYIPL